MAANNHQPNVFDIYNGRQLLERYRLDREGIEFLEAELNQFIGVATRNRSMTVTEKILITLRFPNVIGVIDGTHVQIKAPLQDEPAYVNRMGYHSINTQIVFDGRDNTIDIVARWPGATHDSRMLRESGLHALFLGGHVPGDHSYLLGDSGYPCKNWLLTPYVNPQPGAQTRYNSAHKTTRSRVERGIGQLKRRWGILNGEIGLKPEKACKVIIACAVLHNICKRRNIPLFDILPNAAGQGMNQGVYAGPQEGLRYRECVAQSFF
ncbi:putative nuclease HARBI1 [Mya arenaria]|uniref:putative nuclease HARBI1 n=1 Tax=Mya arenaria TaxID=6604 RepID=UPI0022E2C73A|nr:putative nuclease HARBI1 [Mya arenaria]